jgi:hypothetical protein
MDISPELIAGIAKEGGTVAALIYIWKRLEAVTDAYIATAKESTRVLSESTAAQNNYSRAIDALTATINNSVVRK